MKTIWNSIMSITLYVYLDFFLSCLPCSIKLYEYPIILLTEIFMIFKNIFSPRFAWPWESGCYSFCPRCILWYFIHFQQVRFLIYPVHVITSNSKFLYVNKILFWQLSSFILNSF